jgi:hypothetical protein
MSTVINFSLNFLQSHYSVILKFSPPKKSGGFNMGRLEMAKEALTESENDIKRATKTAGIIYNDMRDNGIRNDQLVLMTKLVIEHLAVLSFY